MDGEEALTRIGVGSTVIITGLVIGAFFQYLIKVFLARFLGPTSYGVFVQGLATAQAVTVISLFGLHMSIPRFISYYKGSGQKHLVEKTTSAAFWLVAISTSLMATALYFSSKWLSTSIFREPALVMPLRIFSLTVLPLGLIYLIISLLRGIQEAKYKIYLDNVVFSGTVLLLVVASLMAGYGLNGVVYAYVFAEVVTVAVGYLIYRKISSYELDLSAKVPPKNLLSFSWPLFVISVLVMMNKWIDTLMMGWLMESAQVGVYNISYGVAGFIALLLSSLGYMFMPVISELYGRGNYSEVLKVYTTSTRWIFTATMPLLAGLLIFPDKVLNLMFGESYRAGSEALMVLAVGFSYKAAKGPAGMVLQSSGKTKRQMLGAGVTTVALVVLNLFLIPLYGMLGAAISTTIGFILGDTVLLLLAKKEINGYPYERRYLRVIGSVLLTSGIIYGLKILLDPGLLASFLLGVLLVLIYFLLLYLFDGVKKEDWRICWEVIGNIR